jgi:hypothetical protein
MGLIGTGIGVQIGGGSGFSPKSLGSALVLWLRSDLGVTIAMGAVVATGTAPPTVTITGTPVQSPPGSVPSIEIDCSLGGPLNTWQYGWKNNGVVQATNVVSSAGPTALGATGLSVSIAAGAATNDNVWTC